MHHPLPLGPLTLPVVGPSKPLGAGRWLALEETTFSGKQGATGTRTWEGLTSLAPVAVDIQAILKHPDKPHRIVLVVQYRPALGAYTIEFPSGLIDAGELPIEAAKRELKEETGYTADPVIVFDNIDLTKQENQRPVQELEESEAGLQMITLELENLRNQIQDLLDLYQGRLVVDSRLSNFAAGIHVHKSLFGSSTTILDS
ncbi:hypothetical protein BZG36_04963 [Bifiguratus adelaidae]|uniref:Nudix hydrolase domain-containing protein n=1 Tax=Bifiguratus adelaidae TaxID=1938954 RepID=A0A261XUK7_9FUNG|nr:hypothetical protein BZG36_04963 [Bifiguratus adelaidae]